MDTLYIFGDKIICNKAKSVRISGFLALSNLGCHIGTTGTIDSGFLVCVDDGLWQQIVRVSHLSQLLAVRIEGSGFGGFTSLRFGDYGMQL